MLLDRLVRLDTEEATDDVLEVLRPPDRVVVTSFVTLDLDVLLFCSPSSWTLLDLDDFLTIRSSSSSSSPSSVSSFRLLLLVCLAVRDVSVLDLEFSSWQERGTPRSLRQSFRSARQSSCSLPQLGHLLARLRVRSSARLSSDSNGALS